MVVSFVSFVSKMPFANYDGVRAPLAVMVMSRCGLHNDRCTRLRRDVANRHQRRKHQEKRRNSSQPYLACHARWWSKKGARHANRLSPKGGGLHHDYAAKNPAPRRVRPEGAKLKKVHADMLERAVAK
jgi:hypothetical protein